MEVYIRSLTYESLCGSVHCDDSFTIESEAYTCSDGCTVGRILDDSYVREVVGFSGGADTVFVNGGQVGRDHVMRPGDRLEVIKRAGEKA